MSDLIISESAGWREITDLLRDVPNFPIFDLWAAVGQGDMKRAFDILGDHFDDEEGNPVVGKAVRMVSVPDDMAGEHVRVWVRE